jgi:lipopolysaccharide export system protein LptA
MKLLGRSLRRSYLLILPISLLLSVAACPVCPASAAEASPPGQGMALIKKDSPMNIASDRMEVNQKDKTIIFDGHVVVVQDDLTITGKRMKVFQEAVKNSAASTSEMVNQIDHIEVEGDVKISQQGKVATSDKAIYYHREQKVVLLGSPQVTQGQDSVRGRLITLFLAEERSIVEGGETTPVQAIIHPDKDKAGSNQPKAR